MRREITVGTEPFLLPLTIYLIFNTMVSATPDARSGEWKGPWMIRKKWPEGCATMGIDAAGIAAVAATRKAAADSLAAMRRQAERG